MPHHPTKNAITTAVGFCTEADRTGRSPFAALIAAAMLALLALGLVPGAALAQTETTEPDPAATTPTDGGTAGEPEPEADEDGIKMPGIRVGDGCVKVGSIKVGDCGGSGDKDPPAEPPEDPAADPLAPDQYGSTSPEAGQDQYPEEPTPDAAENPLSDPMMEQCDVLYPVGGTTGGTTSPEETPLPEEKTTLEETILEETALPQEETALPQEETALPEEKTTLEEPAPEEAQASAESAPEGESTAEEEPAELAGTTSPETTALPEEKTTLEETAPEEEATPPGGTTSGTSEPTEEECQQMRESNEATPQEAEPTPTATDPDPAAPEAADPAEQPEEPQEEEPTPGTTTLEEPATEPEAEEPSPEATDQYAAPETPAPEDEQPEEADPTLTPAAEPEAAPETTELPEEKTTLEETAPEDTNLEDPAAGETVPEDAPEAPAPQPAAAVPSEDVCPGAEPVETSTGGPGNQYTAAFEITGDSFVLSYHATPADPADEEGTLVMDLVETEGGTTVETVRAKSEEPEQTPIEVGPGTYTVNVYSDNRNYEVAAYDCTGQVAPAGEPAPPAEEPAPPAPEEETPEGTTVPAPDDNLGIPGAAPEATPAAAPEDAAEPQPQAGFELPAAPEEQTVPDDQEEQAPPQQEPTAEPEGEPAQPETAPVTDQETAELQPAALRTPQSNATAQPTSLPTRQTQKGVVAVLPETGGEPASALTPQAVMVVFSVTSIEILGLLLLEHRYAAPEETDVGGAAPSEGQRG